MLEINNLNKFFGGLKAVHNASIKVETGSITGLIGPNGAGKTTLFNTIAGLYDPDDGNIFLNNEKLNIKTFENYIDLYLGDKKENPRVYEKINDRWEIAAGLNPNFNFEQISFVNGINTFKGGKHVDYITNQITKKMADIIQKKKKVSVKPNFIRENLMIFVKATIDNPAFDSQIKENLTTPQSKFGSKCLVPDKFI